MASLIYIPSLKGNSHGAVLIRMVFTDDRAVRIYLLKANVNGRGTLSNIFKGLRIEVENSRIKVKRDYGNL